MAIIVQVSGGVVQAVYSESEAEDITVIVVDYDDESEDNPIISEQIIQPLHPDCEVAKDLDKWRNNSEY